MTWPFLSKIIFQLERPEPVPRDNRGGGESTSDFDDKDSNPNEVNADGSCNLDGEPNEKY